MNDVRLIDKAACDRLRAEIEAAGLALDSSAGDRQLQMLPLVLRHLGRRGLATLEGQALGYMRIATRISDIREGGYRVHRGQEDVIADDGVLHRNMARYFLLGEPGRQRRLFEGGPA
jgi:hypothetical protein